MTLHDVLSLAGVRHSSAGAPGHRGRLHARMNVVRPWVAALLVASAIPRASQAQRAALSVTPRLDPSIVTVVSGGRWTLRQVGGSYRVIGVKEGWEHIRYRLFVQWLEESDGGERVRISREVGPLVPDRYSLTDPTLKFAEGRWRLGVRAASAPMEQPSDSLTFILGTPGEIRQSKKP
jgi:hypothetical protein